MTKNFYSRLILSFLILIAILIFGVGYSSTQGTEVEILKNVMVPVRDGVKLATDIYLPSDEGKPASVPFPAILIRTPYGKNGQQTTGEFFSSHGYVVVIQDVRGRFDSEGEFYIYLNEGKDGYDTIQWITEQQWCNGKIGTYGGSYLAATQNALAIHRPDALRTMFVIVGTANYIRDGAGRGGAFALLHNIAYSFRLALNGKEAAKDPKVAAALGSAYANFSDWLLAAPLKSNSPLQWAPSYQRWFTDWCNHTTYDDYWKQNGYNFEEYYSQYPDIPLCFVGGWYDLFKRGTLRNFEGLFHKNRHTKLIMGPWTHSVGLPYAGDVDFGQSAQMSIQDEALRWFDQFLMEKNTEILDEPRVRYFLMGGGTSLKNKEGHFQSGGVWNSANHWPPEGFQSQKFFLHNDGTLRTTTCRSLTTSRFLYDPRNPVPTIGGNIDSGKEIIIRGAQNQVPPPNYFAAHNQLPLVARHDILTFETEPLESDLEVTGPVNVALFVSSETKDTDFTAKLIDVYPPSDDYPAGYAINLEDGILRMRFRNSIEREELLVPGTIYSMTIDLWSISNCFKKGHKVRLDISSSNFPMYDINPNTGESLGKHTHMLSTINTVYHDPDRQSYLLLPVKEK